MKVIKKCPIFEQYAGKVILFESHMIRKSPFESNIGIFR